MNLPQDATKEQEAEAAAKRTEINRKVLDILRPEIVKLKELVSYTLQAVSLFHGCITHLTNKDAHKEVVPQAFHLALVKLMDTILILDNLKDIKTCLHMDFSRYKRVVGAHPSIEILEEISQLQAFLSNPDPRKAKNYVFLSLRDEVKRVNGHENIFLDALELILSTLQNQSYVTPQEHFRLLRVLPYYMLIADGEGDDPKSFNMFKTSKIKLSNLQKVFKAYPIVPLYGDMTIVMELILQRSPHYDAAKMGSNWGSLDTASSSSGSSSSSSSSGSMLPPYDLCAQWESMRSAYSEYTTRFTAAMNRCAKYPFQKLLDEVAINMSPGMFALVKQGFDLLAQWKTNVKLLLSWKYMHPCSLEQLLALQVDPQADGIEYGRVLRYNLSKAELSALADAISLIKSLSALLDRAEPTLAPYVRFHIHHRLQQLAQADLMPLLHRLDKRNKPILPTLLKLRALVADWSNEGTEPRKDYKEYSRKQGAAAVAVKHPPRVVSAAAAQLFILRTQIGTLCDSDSELRKKASVFGKADLEKADVELLQQFYDDSFFYSYVLDYAATLREVSDMGDLWYREFFLEMTRCIQFPIEMSLPWMLAEHLVMKHVSNAPMMEIVLYVLDIYNDAAHRSLHVLNQQYMYDEIEAETNLVIDQLYFLLSDEAYNYFKDLAAAAAVDKALKDKLEILKGPDHLEVEPRHMVSLLSQRHIQLLGRSINFSFILGQNINNKIYRDIDFAVKRFESSDARGITELKTLLDIVSDTHARLSCFLELDSFDSMLSEVNESFSPSSFRGRISLHMLSSLAKDIFPNFSYNHHTRRFVSAPIAIRPMQYGKPPKQSAVSQAFGSGGAGISKVFENCARLTRGFFGRPHLEAYLSLGVSCNDLSMLVDQCLKNMYDKIVDVSEYLDALKEGIPPCAPPKFMFRTVGGYGYYEGKLRAILDYDDLKPEVFQNFREIGNTIAFLNDLSETLELSDQFDFMLIAPFLGFKPPSSSSTTSSSGGGGSSSGEAKLSGIDSSNGGGGSSNSANSSPLLRIITHVSAEAGASAKRLGASVKAGEVWSRIPAVTRRLADSATNILGSSEGAGAGSSGKSLMRWVLLQVEEFLYQENLTVEWASNAAVGNHSSSGSDNSSDSAPYHAFAVDNASGFHRLWSALSFLFCIVDEEPATTTAAAAGDTAAAAVGMAEEEEESLISNEMEFGHGFTIAGCMLLHLLGQRSTFNVLDFATYVLQLDDHDQKLREIGDAQQQQTAAMVDDGLLQETRNFVEAARTQQLMQLQWFSLLEALHQPRASYVKHSISTVRFSPPAVSDDY